MNFQGVVINVSDLSRSIDFYCDVLDFTLLSREEQLAAVSAPGSDRTEVVVLRALGSSPMGGARHVGLRAFLLDVDSPDQLERIAHELDSRKLLVSRREHSDWIAVVGRDPDRVAVVVSCRKDGGARADESWKLLDDLLYGVGE